MSTTPTGLPEDVVGELREALQARRRDVVARLHSMTGRFQEIVDSTAGANTDDEHDPEGTTIAFERSQVDALARTAERDLEDVDAALARIADSTYGTCEVCGRPIPVERLEVRPTARTCVGCAAAQ